MARFFVSYRRNDSAGHAGRLADRLRAHFGRDQVFLDVDLAPGVDYAQHVRDTISECDALIVVIGPRWATIENPDGTRRLDDPGDLVRAEVEIALQQSQTTTIPVLVEGASIPETSQLPPPLRPLNSRNALEISDSRFDYDAGRLVAALERITPGADIEASAAPVRAPSSGSRVLGRLRRRQVVAGILLACLAAGALLYVLLPENVVVPDVVGAKSAFDAETTLTDKGLKLAPELKSKVTNDAAPGTVIGQVPGAGEKAEEGSEVSLQIAVDSGRATVPNVVGKTASEAQQVLRQSNLTLGEASPQPLDPAKKISRQIPAANQVVKPGTPVDIFLRGK